MKKKFEELKKKYLKRIGIAILFVALCLYGIFNVKFQSVQQYKIQHRQTASDVLNEPAKSQDSTESIKDVNIPAESGEEKNESETVVEKSDSFKNTGVGRSIEEESSSKIDEGNSNSSGDKKSSASQIITNQVINESNSGLSSSDENKNSDSKKDSGSTDESEKYTINCSIEIRCDTLADSLKEKWSNKKKDPSHIVPENGEILPVTKVTISKPANGKVTALDVLMKIADESEGKITVDEMGNYVKGINQLYEKDAGPQSGWMYFVNSTDKYINQGMSQYEVKEGDKIMLRYTCNGGKDINK